MPLHVEPAPASGVAEKTADPFQIELPPALPMMAPITPMYGVETPPLLAPPLPPELLLPPEELPPEELPPPLLPPEELPPPLPPDELPPLLPPELLLPLGAPPTPPPFVFECDVHAPSEAWAPMERQPRTTPSEVFIIETPSRLIWDGSSAAYTRCKATVAVRLLVDPPPRLPTDERARARKASDP
jgi:histone-lysine N-methyltransferase MLL2